ncbi:T9SS type A sorting domain-containing protein [Tamlana sp. 62-3]|uniref:T9SS type A sorting domain-containing protein n=1 Tax=Neotamlana sargassicola TaxID=2883125 RepID=A0A9X1I4Z7_9FLAO|nr:T9SS type A sorting domain-containing protein [Tamlana sargassicola]MCB4807593.1 T9SS type A sorting domain-containing protein [Tamlana sargassicola]
MKKQLLALFTLSLSFTIQAQITQVKEINDNGTSSSLPANLYTFNGKIYFAADDSNGSNTPGGADLGKELWVTDGTEAGTTFVKDLNTGAASSSPTGFFEYNNTLYFSANNGTSSVLFSTDGTESGTNATGHPFVFNPIETGGLVYFVLTTDSNKLYQFDDTNTSPVTNNGTGTEALVGAHFTAFNNKLLCYMDYSEDEPTIGRELYEYNPSTGLFTLIKDIDEGTGDSSISNFTVVNNEVFFKADDALWKTDGTNTGTVAVENASSLSGINNFFAWNNILYFEADNGTSEDQLWAYNPNTDAISNISNITGGASNDHDPSDYAILGDYLYYAGEVADDTAQYLFRTDGSTSERVDSNIKDIDDLVVLNDKLYFEGDNGTTGNELYSFDPATLSTSSSSFEIISVYPNPATDYIMVPTSLLNKDFSIYSSSGNLIKKGIISSEKINLNLNSGLYLIKIESNNNILTKKVLIK